jgi:endonuclease/exonuclease/phosphatase family metal-dependent hydrolase
LIVDDGVWRDPFAATDPVTYHLDFLPSHATPHRIDYMLVRGHPILACEVLFDAPLALPDGRRMYASDHVALSARIGLTNGRDDPDQPR